MNTDYGKNLRKLFSNGFVKRILDFGSLPVFSNAETYPAIFIITKFKNTQMEYLKLSSLNVPNYNNLIFTKIDYKNFSNNSWNFSIFFDFLQ